MDKPLPNDTSNWVQAWLDQRPFDRPLRCWMLGYGPLGQAVAEGLIHCNPQLATLTGVFPWSTKPSEKRFASEPGEFLFRQWLKRQRIPILGFPSVNHFRFVQRLLHDQIDVVFVATWGELIAPSLLSQTHTLFINIHPSLLPEFRGPNPYSAVLLAQSSETGVSAHVIDSQIDNGPLIAQYKLTIHPDDNGLTLRQRIAELTKEHINELVRTISQAKSAWPEQTGKGSYKKALTIKDCQLNWEEDPIQMDHRLRAIYPWEQPWRPLAFWRLVADSGRIVSHTTPSTMMAGQVIQRKGPHLWIATQHADKAIMLVNPSLNSLWRVLNWVVLPLLLRPGRQL